MSTVVRTKECFPEWWAQYHGGVLGWVLPVGEPDHEHCSGGHHVDGVMGGWMCPCPCHRPAVTERPQP